MAPLRNNIDIDNDIIIAKLTLFLSFCASAYMYSADFILRDVFHQRVKTELLCHFHPPYTPLGPTEGEYEMSSFL